MKKLLTISVAAYNAEQYIRKCLNSFLNNQVAEDLQVIVVNDGSQDNTLEIIRDYEKRYPDIICVVDKENGGHGSTINASIQLATGKYYKVVDADDWVSNEGIEALVKFLKSSDVDLIVNPYVETYMNNLSDKVVIPYQSIAINRIYYFDDVCSMLDIPMHSMTLKTSIIKKVGPVIDENCFYVDMEYNLFPVKYIKTICCLREPVYYYLLGNQEQSVSNINMVKRRGQREKVIKSLIRDYNESYKEIGEQKANYIATKIKYLIYSHYKLYLCLSIDKSFGEVKRFDEWLRKNSNEDIYYGLPNGMIMKFIRFQRRKSFKSYKKAVRCLQLLHLVKVYES